MKMEDEMEEIRWFDEMRASHNDLVSVQNSILFERWLALMDGQDNADSMAAVSSS